MELDIIDVHKSFTNSSDQANSLRQKHTEETITGLAVEIWAVIILENAPYHMTVSMFEGLTTKRMRCVMLNIRRLFLLVGNERDRAKSYTTKVGHCWIDSSLK